MSVRGLIAPFFSLLSSIVLYGCSTVCSSVHLLKGILVCFQFGTAMNKAAGNIRVQAFGWT